MSHPCGSGESGCGRCLCCVDRAQQASAADMYTVCVLLECGTDSNGLWVGGFFLWKLGCRRCSLAEARDWPG